MSTHPDHGEQESVRGSGTRVGATRYEVRFVRIESRGQRSLRKTADRYSDGVFDRQGLDREVGTVVVLCAASYKQPLQRLGR